MQLPEDRSQYYPSQVYRYCAKHMQPSPVSLFSEQYVDLVFEVLENAGGVVRRHVQRSVSR